ncbi:MAG: recombination regulator RecX [Actinomycetota bacterium]|nr:recombination regulator RecX [Actinomycetota bacterium]
MSPKAPTGNVDRSAAIEALAAKIAAVGPAVPKDEVPTIQPPEGPDSARARDIVLRQLAAAPRPRAVLAQKLRSGEIPEDVAALVLDRFQQVGLIDDRAYAELYVTAKHRDRALGRHALRAELRRQGVAEDDFADAVAEVDTGAEARRAAELVGKRVASAMAAGPDAARRRLLGLLARRGYTSSLATAVVESAIASFGG